MLSSVHQLKFLFLIIKHYKTNMYRVENEISIIYSQARFISKLDD